MVLSFDFSLHCLLNSYVVSETNHMKFLGLINNKKQNEMGRTYQFYINKSSSKMCALQN